LKNAENERTNEMALFIVSHTIGRSGKAKRVQHKPVVGRATALPNLRIEKQAIAGHSS